MQLAVDELGRSLKYHTKQLEENLQSIRNKEETIELLKESNKKHISIIEQISKAIEFIKMDIDFAESTSDEKEATPSIKEVI